MYTLLKKNKKHSPVSICRYIQKLSFESAKFSNIYILFRKKKFWTFFYWQKVKNKEKKAFMAYESNRVRNNDIVAPEVFPNFFFRRFRFQLISNFPFDLDFYKRFQLHVYLLYVYKYIKNRLGDRLFHHNLSTQTGSYLNFYFASRSAA